MPVGDGAITRARDLIAAGDLSQAQELLDEALAAVPTDPAQADPAQAEAAALLTGVLLALGEPLSARGWAAWGHAGYRHLYGEQDRRTLHTLGLLAAVLARVGAHGRATARYQQLIDAYLALDGPGSDRVLAARADLATVEHARGHCADARLRLATVIAEHQATHGGAHPVGVRMQIRLAAMWRDCGGFDQANTLLAQARRDAGGIDADSPVHRLIDVAVQAPVDSRHCCGQQPVTGQQPATGQKIDRTGDAARVTAATSAPLPGAGLLPGQTRRSDAAAAADASTTRYEAIAITLADARARPDAAAAPLTAPLFTPVDYLPSPPDLVPAHLADARPTVRPDQPAEPRRAYSVWVLAAGSAGIVLVTLLFLLVVSSMRQG